MPTLISPPPSLPDKIGSVLDFSDVWAVVSTHTEKQLARELNAEGADYYLPLKAVRQANRVTIMTPLISRYFFVNGERSIELARDNHLRPKIIPVVQQKRLIFELSQIEKELGENRFLPRYAFNIGDFCEVGYGAMMGHCGYIETINQSTQRAILTSSDPRTTDGHTGRSGLMIGGAPVEVDLEALSIAN